MNKELALAVAAETGDDPDKVEAVVRAHQNNYPGSWRDWEMAEKVPSMVKLMRTARDAKETSPERIARLDW
jgi:hypothetical protein